MIALCKIANFLIKKAEKVNCTKHEKGSCLQTRAKSVITHLDISQLFQYTSSNFRSILHCWDMYILWKPKIQGLKNSYKCKYFKSPLRYMINVGLFLIRILLLIIVKRFCYKGIWRSLLFCLFTYKNHFSCICL